MAGKGTLTAEGKVIKKGSRVIVCESTVHQGEKVIAIGLFSYLIWER
jgi:acyl-coenzyme A thioesterase PaaI-like protein